MYIDSSPSCSYYNLFVEYGEVIPASDQLLLLLHALGGSDVPEILFTSARFPQRRWNAEGEIESTSAGNYGLPSELVNLLSDDLGLAQATASPLITRSVLEGGTIAWSLKSELSSFLSQALLPQTVDALGITALKLICFACPPCYEGNTHWYFGHPEFRPPLIVLTQVRVTKEVCVAVTGEYGEEASRTRLPQTTSARGDPLLL